MQDSKPEQRPVGIVGTQPEAILLSVLFAEAKVQNFLVGNFEPITRYRSTCGTLDEARWLLGIHSASGTIRLLPSLDESQFPNAENLVLTGHSNSIQDALLQERLLRTVSKNITKNSNLIFTGLSRPGHTTAITETIQRYGGLDVGSDLGLCYLPLLWSGETLRAFKETPRIIAGSGDTVQNLQELFLKVFPSISSTRRIRSAEAAGLFVPVYKEVVGALEQELARLCIREQVDYSEALSLCRGLGLNTLASPRAFPSRDSIGSEIALSSPSSGSTLRLIRAARCVNQESDERVVALVKNALALCGQRLRHSKIAVLGVDGLGINNRLRPEPIELFQTLKRRGASISVFPGYNSNWANRDSFGENVRVEYEITRAVEKAHCALVALKRVENGELNPRKLASEMSHPAAICDLTGVLEASNVERAGLLYTSMGRGSSEA